MLAQTNSQNVGFNILGKLLLEASKNGNEEEVRRLMTQGAPFSADCLGMSPLHFSCMNGYTNITELLCRSGASWNGRTKAEKTALHYAAQKGHKEIVALLIKLGADVNAVDMIQMTPIHWAVVGNHFLVIKLLVENNAELNVRNKFDRSPIETAEDNCNYHIVEYLKSTINHRRESAYEVDTEPSSPVTDSNHAALVSFAALCGSPSLTESLPWFHPETTSGGAAVLLEGTNMVTLTEGGKMALQAYIYEDEPSRVDDDPSLPVLPTNHDSSEKILSVAPDNQVLNTSLSNSVGNQPARIPLNVKLKTKENTLPSNKLKRKLPLLDQTRHMDNRASDTSDYEELKRKLAEAQSEAALYREKLLMKEQEVNLWKKKLEISQQNRT